MSEDKTTKSLLEAEKLVQKIKNKVKRHDLDYTIQAVIDSTTPNTIRFAVRVTPLNEAVGPIIFVANSGPELLEKLQYRLDNGLDEDELMINYHESMVKNVEKTLKYHQDKIEELNNKEEEEE